MSEAFARIDAALRQQEGFEAMDPSRLATTKRLAGNSRTLANILREARALIPGPVTNAEVEAAARAYDAASIPPVMCSRIAMRAALEAARNA